VIDQSLASQVDELLAAVEGRDNERFFGALQGIAAATHASDPEEVQAALVRLVPVLESIPLGMGGDLAQLAGGLAGHATDPAVVVPVLVGRATEAMEQAARFERLHREAYGEVPDPEDGEQIQPVLERFVGEATERGLTEQEAWVLVQAWFCGGQWVQPVLFLSQRQDVRAMLPDRGRLIAAVEPVRESIGTAHWLYGLLLVLDDEPLVVLHRATGRGFRVTVSGIGDNFQLHTLLAAALIGDEARGLLPGERPSAAEIAAAGDGEVLDPPGGIRGNFNLVGADGTWIWNEGRPADIPALDGTRVVVLDPPPYQRTWNAGRAYPLMRPTVTVEGALTAGEAAHWLSRVKPA